jgi:putative hydrolase of the HAD superfamily
MLDPNKIRAVVFDLDDTLRHSIPDGNAHFVERARSLGLDIGAEAQREARRWVHQYWATSPELQEDIQSFAGMDDEFWVNYGRRHLQALGRSAQEAERYAPELQAYMRENYEPADELKDGAQVTLRTLKASGYQVGLLTNRSRPIYEVMHKLDLDLDLDFFLAAAQLGAFKPHPEIFTAMLDLLQLSPEHVAYVGDNYYADIIGAQQAGLTPVLIDPHGLYPDADVPIIEAVPEILELLQVEPVA